MTSRSIRAAAAGAALVTTVAGLPLMASTATATAPAAPAASVPAALRASSITARPTRVLVPKGSRTYITGTTSAPALRPVYIQRKSGTRWVTVNKRYTNARRAYSIAFPTMVTGSFSYRAYAPAWKGYAGAVSRGFQVHIGQGSASSYTLWYARWNPCQTINWRFNPARAPRYALRDIKIALARNSMISGLRFVYRGTTSYVPGTQPAGQWERYPSGTNMVFAWTYPGRSRYLPTSAQQQGVLAVGGYLAPAGTYRGFKHIRQGFIVGNASRTQTVPGFGVPPTGWGTWGQILMHEGGHAVGLGHTSDASQLMYYQVRMRTPVWGLGDMYGLRNVGRARGCFPAGSASALTGPATAVFDN